MIERSQGFKTFISFLLTIAIESNTKTHKSKILILDEPETHLHPSGVRFMRKELKRLSELGHNVFFATHSIFMIDRKSLTSNMIVRKNYEYTQVQNVEKNNITQESVIYEALGTSVDEFSIGNKNIMFEGGLDLRMFKFFVDHCIPKRENKFKDYDFLNGGGTKQMTQFFVDKTLPEQSEWRLILDNDLPPHKMLEKLKC